MFLIILYNCLVNSTCLLVSIICYITGTYNKCAMKSHFRDSYWNKPIHFCFYQSIHLHYCTKIDNPD